MARGGLTRGDEAGSETGGGVSDGKAGGGGGLSASRRVLRVDLCNFDLEVVAVLLQGVAKLLPHLLSHGYIASYVSACHDTLAGELLLGLNLLHGLPFLKAEPTPLLPHSDISARLRPSTGASPPFRHTRPLFPARPLHKRTNASSSASAPPPCPRRRDRWRCRHRSDVWCGHAPGRRRGGVRGGRPVPRGGYRSRLCRAGASPHSDVSSLCDARFGGPLLRIDYPLIARSRRISTQSRSTTRRGALPPRARVSYASPRKDLSRRGTSRTGSTRLRRIPEKIAAPRRWTCVDGRRRRCR